MEFQDLRHLPINVRWLYHLFTDSGTKTHEYTTAVITDVYKDVVALISLGSSSKTCAGLRFIKAHKPLNCDKVGLLQGEKIWRWFPSTPLAVLNDLSNIQRLSVFVGHSPGVGYPSSRFILDKILSLWKVLSDHHPESLSPGQFTLFTVLCNIKIFTILYTSNQRFWVRSYECVAEISMFDHLSKKLKRTTKRTKTGGSLNVDNITPQQHNHRTNRIVVCSILKLRGLFPPLIPCLLHSPDLAGWVVGWPHCRFCWTRSVRSLQGLEVP